MQTNAMKAIEVTATIDGQGQLALDQPLEHSCIVVFESLSWFRKKMS
jgi:hypothetical protein